MKTHKINGKEIQSLNDDDFLARNDFKQLAQFVSNNHHKINELLDALDEKKEECLTRIAWQKLPKRFRDQSETLEVEIGKLDNKCEHGNTYGSGGKYCSCKKEEPKSTLRDVLGLNIQEISDWGLNVTGGLLEADKIISLFKDTLLREVEYKFYGANDPKVIDIINLIKNI